jgi:hypothetical protein
MFASLATLCRGYRTSPIPTGHGVFETEAAFAALHEEASKELRSKGGPPLAVHIPCRIYPQLIDWALRAGLKLVRYAALNIGVNAFRVLQASAFYIQRDRW